MKRFVLSIIVPTRNRQEYAYRCIKQVLSTKDPRVQIVVMDNSDDCTLKSIIGEFKADVRLKYEYAQEPISFISNFSKALSISEGEYACFIGDDDGINHEIIEFTQWMKENGIDVAKPELIAFYRWPLALTEHDNCRDSAGLLQLQHFTGTIRPIDTKASVIDYLRGGCGSYLEYDLAKPYHGIVKRDVYERVRQLTGSYFGGLTPDIYGAIAISLQNTKAIAVDYPLTIPGECPLSGSSDSRHGRHTGKLGDAPHFFGHAEYTWNPMVPSFYSVETIWSESALRAVSDMRMIDLLNQVNYGAMYFALLRKYPGFYREVWNSYRDASKRLDRKLARSKVCFQAIVVLVMGVFRRLKRVVFVWRKVTGIASKSFAAIDIGAAADELAAYLKFKEQSINNIIKPQKVQEYHIVDELGSCKCE